MKYRSMVLGLMMLALANPAFAGNKKKKSDRKTASMSAPFDHKYVEITVSEDAKMRLEPTNVNLEFNRKGAFPGIDLPALSIRLLSPIQQGSFGFFNNREDTYKHDGLNSPNSDGYARASCYVMLQQGSDNDEMKAMLSEDALKKEKNFDHQIKGPDNNIYFEYFLPKGKYRLVREMNGFNAKSVVYEGVGSWPLKRADGKRTTAQIYHMRCNNNAGLTDGDMKEIFSVGPMSIDW